MSKKRKAFGAIPQEISQNIQAPETAPSDKRISGRTKQLNFKVREEFYWQLKNKATEERCMMVEVLEKAFAEYERGRQEKSDKELEKYRKIIEPKPKKVFFHPHQDFTCDKCGASFQDETAYSYAASLGKSTKTYCSNCVEE